jgi:hypothetical protein
MASKSRGQGRCSFVRTRRSHITRQIQEKIATGASEKITLSEIPEISR